MKFFAGKIAVPKSTAGFEQIKRANDVRGDEIARPGDGTIHMRFRREVHDMRNAVLLDDTQRGGLVAQIHLLKNVFLMAGNFFEVRQMSGVSEAIEIDQLRDVRLINDVMDKIRADEARAAGD